MYKTRLVPTSTHINLIHLDQLHLVGILLNSTTTSTFLLKPYNSFNHYVKVVARYNSYFLCYYNITRKTFQTASELKQMLRGSLCHGLNTMALEKKPLKLVLVLKSRKTNKIVDQPRSMPFSQSKSSKL